MSWQSKISELPYILHYILKIQYGDHNYKKMTISHCTSIYPCKSIFLLIFQMSLMCIIQEGMVLANLRRWFLGDALIQLRVFTPYTKSNSF